MDEVWSAEGRRRDPNAGGHHPRSPHGAASFGGDGLPDAEGSVQADHSQQKHGAEHVGVFEEAVELADKDAKGPVVEEELLNEGEDPCEAEDQVGYGQVHQPHVGHLRLKRSERWRNQKIQ